MGDNDEEQHAHKKPRKLGIAPAHGAWPERAPRDPATEQPNPHAKRKVALLLAYNGAKYFGLQKNPDVTTVEEVLEGALHRAGGISAENFGTLQKVSWSRAGRTDKGVHAVGQIISVKLILEPDGLLERINAELTGTDLAVLGMERATNNFCAHTLCTSREYEYMLPLSVLRSGDADAAGDASAGLSASEHERLTALFKTYEGTHSFHNFTDGKLTHKDKSAQRYMIHFRLGEPLTLGGIPFVCLRFHGQSFLLHQIRKMVAMLCASFRGWLPPDAIRTALKAPRVSPIPLAPSCALTLRQCFYQSYERRRTADKNSVHFPACESAQQAFLAERILPHVAQCTERGEFDRFVDQLQAYRMELPPAAAAEATPTDAAVTAATTSATTAVPSKDAAEATDSSTSQPSQPATDT